MIDFLAGKVGAGFVALALVGAMLVTSGGFTREAGRGELEAVVDEIARALAEVDGLGGEVRLVLELPGVSSPFELVISGTRWQEQVIHLSASGRARAERWLLLANEVNGGDFELVATSPASITILKHEGITLELSPWD